MTNREVSRSAVDEDDLDYDAHEAMFGRPRTAKVGETAVPAVEGKREPDLPRNTVAHDSPVISKPFETKFLKRYGPVIGKNGFTQVPNLLLDELIPRAQLSPGEALVLVRLLRHWIDGGGWPSPGQECLAEQTGQSVRSIQRCVSKLRKKNLITTKVRHRRGSNDRTGDEYDLRPLIVMLYAIAEDIEGRKVGWGGKLVEVPRVVRQEE
jgi:DNA-binding MarR family transcriptional regulator